MADTAHIRRVARHILTAAAILIGSGIPAVLIIGQWYSTVRALIDPMTTCWIPTGEHFLYASEVVSIVAFAIAPAWFGATALLLIALYFIKGTSRNRWLGLVFLPILLAVIVWYGPELAIPLESKAHASVRNACIQ